MKTFIVMTLVALLAGCGGMHMRSSGGTNDTSSSGYGQDPNDQDRIFNSYIK